MKSLLIGIASVVLAVGMVAAAGGVPQDAERLLKTAMNTELVDGNLRAAIEQYEKVVQSGNRVLAAQALVHMAECYQKLGDAEAQRIYERVLREYADQKDAVAIARARLGGTAAVASAKGDRAVWTGSNAALYGPLTVSSDGRFIIAANRLFGELMVHDVAANVDRALTPRGSGSQWAGYLRMSTDGRQVVYLWGEEADENHGYRLGFRIAALQGSGFLEPRQVFLANGDDLGYVNSFDWSPDGKWIAAAIRRNDGTGQIALITVADGSFRVLKSMDWNVPETIFFSRDSRFIAYDLPATDSSQLRDVFVLAIDGSREIPAVVHSANEAVMGWSSDGSRLLFSSDRTGSVGLWALPFADGKAQGSPELLKSDIGSSVSLGLTASGALYVYKRISSRDIAIAPIDVEAGKLLGPPVSFTQGFVKGARNPKWSPDGKYLAYPADCNSNNGDCIAIRAVATGQVRLLPRTMNSIAALNWSPDGRSLLTRGKDVRGRVGIFQIDAQSGEATAVILSDGLGQLAQWSPDGKKVYFNRGPVFVERDLASGSERDVNREVGVRTGPLSPDGQYFAARRLDPSTKTASLLLVPVAGGQPRELLRLTQPEVFAPLLSVWTPDSSAVIITKDTGELWLVPVTGGRPRKLDIDPNIWREGSAGPGALDQGFSLSPDGRSIAFQMGKSASEVWALENFLPAPSAKK